METEKKHIKENVFVLISEAILILIPICLLNLYYNKFDWYEVITIGLLFGAYKLFMVRMFYKKSIKKNNNEKV